MSSIPAALPVGPTDRYDNQPPLTEVQRVVNTFAAPGKTFADIRRNQSWWLPLLIVALFTYLFVGVALTKVGPTNLAVGSIKNNPTQSEKMQNASPEDRERMVSVTAAILKVSLLVSPLFVLLSAAIGALLLWVGFNFILGGSGTYPGMFAVMIFSFLPGTIRSLLVTAVMLFGNTENFNLNDPIGTNPGFFLGSDVSHFLKAVLGSLDVFSIWTLLLMAIGGAIVARVKVRSGVVMVFAVWLIYVLGKAAVIGAMS